MEDRKLGFWMCVALVVGNMIGSGVFLLPSSLAPYGLNSVFAWIATSAGAIFLACVFSELSRAFPDQDGSYGFVRLAFGDLAGFVVAWGYWISIWVGNAAIATGSVSYLGEVFPVVKPPLLSMGLTLVIIWTLTLVNVAGVRAAGGVQVVTTIFKLIPLVAVVGLGIYLALADRAAFHAPVDIPFSGDAVSGAAALTLWALLGFESAAVASQRVRDPERTIPRATIAGTLIVAAVYIISCTTILLLIPHDQLANSRAPFADVARLFWGQGASILVAVLAVVSGLGALNGWTLLQGEVPLQLARSGVFPPVFARLSRFGTPVFSLCFASVLVTLLVLLNFGKSLVAVFTFMALVSTTATLVLYMGCAAALLAQLHRRRIPYTGARAAWLAVIGELGGAYALWTLYGAGKEAVLWGLALVGVAVPIYYARRPGSESTR